MSLSGTSKSFAGSKGFVKNNRHAGFLWHFERGPSTTSKHSVKAIIGTETCKFPNLLVCLSIHPFAALSYSYKHSRIIIFRDHPNRFRTAIGLCLLQSHTSQVSFLWSFFKLTHCSSTRRIRWFKKSSIAMSLFITFHRGLGEKSHAIFNLTVKLNVDLHTPT
jgi:hypothetical protein